MVYLFGLGGFAVGFMFGLFVISLFLRGVNNRDLMANNSLRWTYGVAVWIFAGLGAYGAVWAQAKYFAGM